VFQTGQVKKSKNTLRNQSPQLTVKVLDKMVMIVAHELHNFMRNISETFCLAF
jgi:hypothetical protein